jgi:hypothetical protein
VILEGRFGGIVGVVFVAGHRVGDQLKSADASRWRRSTPEGRLEECMGADVVQLREHVLVAVRRWQRLHVFNDRVGQRLRASEPPLSPIASDIARGRKCVAHRDVVSAHCFLGVIGIVAVGERVPLMKPRLLGSSRRRANRASVSSAEVDSCRGQPIQIGCSNIGQPLCFAFGLAVGADRSPAHVVDEEVQNVRPLGFC